MSRLSFSRDAPELQSVVPCSGTTLGVRHRRGDGSSRLPLADLMPTTVLDRCMFTDRWRLLTMHTGRRPFLSGGIVDEVAT